MHMIWHKNEKNRISSGQMNMAKKKSREGYKELNTVPTGNLNSYIDSAIQDADKLVLEC